MVRRRARRGVRTGRRRRRGRERATGRGARGERERRRARAERRRGAGGGLARAENGRWGGRARGNGARAKIGRRAVSARVVDGIRVVDSFARRVVRRAIRTEIRSLVVSLPSRGAVRGGSVERRRGVRHHRRARVVEALGGAREIRRHGRRVGDRASVRRVRSKVFTASGLSQVAPRDRHRHHRHRDV